MLLHVFISLFFPLTYHITSLIFEQFIFVHPIVFFVYGSVRPVCSAEIKSAIKGISNTTIIQTYMRWKFYMMKTAIFIIIPIIVTGHRTENLLLMQIK